MTPLDPNLPVRNCKNGHPMTAENTRIVTGGARQCRQCDKERAQAKRDRLRGDKPKFRKDPSTLKTECLRGHSLTDEANIRWIDTPWGKQKQCIECGKSRRVNYRERFQLIATGVIEPAAPSHLQKEFCLRGHSMEGENVYVKPDGSGRVCRKCSVIRTRKHQNKDRDAHLDRRNELRQQELASKAGAVKAAVIRLRGEFSDRDALLAEITKVLKVTATE